MWSISLIIWILEELALRKERNWVLFRQNDDKEGKLSSIFWNGFALILKQLKKRDLRERKG